MINKIQIETDFLTLMEIAEKTGNPEVAIALLNGTYQQPELCEFDMAQESKDHKTGDPITKKLNFVSYNKWTDEVNYTEAPFNHMRSMTRIGWNKQCIWGDETIANLHELTHDNH